MTSPVHLQSKILPEPENVSNPVIPLSTVKSLLLANLTPATLPEYPAQFLVHDTKNLETISLRPLPPSYHKWGFDWIAIDLKFSEQGRLSSALWSHPGGCLVSAEDRALETRTQSLH